MIDALRGTNMSGSTVRRVLAVATALSVCGPVALAQEPQQSTGIEEVVITAQKREESLQDAPIAISAFTAETLANRGITDFADVAKATPSIAVAPYPSSSNTLILFMRGQGVSDSGQITLDSAVGLYQDGFYIPRGQMVTFDLADIERVEVLRGPQGTLYGRNTTGGAVNLVSKKPSGEFGFKQEIGFGNNGRLRSLTVLDLPKWGGLAAKFSFLKREQDGYVKNTGPSHDFGEEDQTAGRVALRWDTGAPFTADYFYERGDLDSTPIYYTNPALVGLIPGYSDSGRPEDHTYRPFNLPESQGEYESHGLTLTWKVSDALTLKSLTGYRDVATKYYQDYADAFFAGFRSYDDIRYHVFSQEVQAVGSLNDGRVDYVAGLYYSKEDASHFENVTITNLFPPPVLLTKDRDVTAESKSKAVYAQVTWTPPVLDDHLDLTLGARYTQDERAATRTFLISFFGFPIAQEPAPGLVNSNNVESSRFNPAFTANYHWTDDVSTYLRVATGYKAGGSTESADIGRFGITFKPENVLTYELGLKSYLFDRRVRLNAAAFLSEFDDMQMFFLASPTDNSVIQGLNPGKASVAGFEFETLWQPLDTLSFTLDYTFLDAKQDEVIARAGTIFDPAVNPSSPYQVGQNIKDLFRVSYAPENSVNVGANWTFLQTADSKLTATANYRWQDRVYQTQPAGKGVPGADLYSQPSLGLVDGRLSWKTGFANDSSLRIDFWGKNLADREWYSSAIGIGGPVAVGATPPGFFMHAIAWAERRTYGVNFVYEY
ncbi:MAG: Vitamin B12 transporter BtuB [Steroidobacteraceae bacterium]|nr:Vitamin B12 transporter BtuB [Steroidobacteraceae bacterium]